MSFLSAYVLAAGLTLIVVFIRAGSKMSAAITAMRDELDRVFGKPANRFWGSHINSTEASRVISAYPRHFGRTELYRRFQVQRKRWILCGIAFAACLFSFWWLIQRGL